MSESMIENIGVVYEGALISPPDERDYQAKDTIAMGIRPLKYEPPVRLPVTNQGMEMCCVGESLALALGYFRLREGGGKNEYSAQYIYHNRVSPHQWKGKGMYARYALDDLCKYGSCNLNLMDRREEYTSPERQNLVKSLAAQAKPSATTRYFRCNTQEEFHDAIFQTGAGMMVVDVKVSWAIAWGKTILPQCNKSDTSCGQHAICAIGYDENGNTLIQNSAGTEWGNNGFIYVPKNYQGIVEMWGIADDTPSQWDVVKLRIGSTTIDVNGRTTNMDTAPIIYQNRTMAVLRAPLEAMGVTVKYDAGKIDLTKGKDNVKLAIDDRFMWVNGVARVLDVPPIIRDNRTLVPVRAPFEALGINVEYVADTQEIIFRQRRM